MPEYLDWHFCRYDWGLHVLRLVLGRPFIHVYIFYFFPGIFIYFFEFCHLKISKVMFPLILACFRIIQSQKWKSVLLKMLIWDLKCAGNGESYSSNFVSILFGKSLFPCVCRDSLKNKMHQQHIKIWNQMASWQAKCQQKGEGIFPFLNV